MINIKSISARMLLCAALLAGSLVVSCALPDGYDYGSQLRYLEDPGNPDYTNFQTVTGVTNLVIQGTQLLSIDDPVGDTYGNGELRWPPFYRVTNVLDLNQVIVSADSNYIYFYVAMLNRDYQNPELALEGAGFRWLMLGGFLGQVDASPAQPDAELYSPEDDGNYSSQYWMATGLSITNVNLVYGFGLFGKASPVMGAMWDMSFARTDVLGGNVVDITTNDLVRTPVIYPDVSTVLAFRLARMTNGVSILPGGTWKLMLYTYGWEDYGRADAYPGKNGLLRQTVLGDGREYQFGRGTNTVGGLARVADYLAPTKTQQVTVLNQKVIDASMMLNLVLPDND